MVLALCILSAAVSMELHTRLPTEPAAFLEQKARMSSLGLSADAEEMDDVDDDPAPDDIDTLKAEVTELQAEKKGLVFTVRRLLKANQTEAQKKMLNALRGATMQEKAAEKKIIDMQTADGAEISRLQKQKSEVEEKLKQKEADLAVLRERGNGGSLGMARDDSKLVAAMAKLKQQNAQLQGEKKGLEGTVQKLWNGNAPAHMKSMLKVLDQEEERLKVIDETRQAEEKQFAQEKSELVKKLSDTESRYEMDEQVLKTLQGDNQWLRASLQNQSSLETDAKFGESLRDKNMQLEATVKNAQLELSKQSQKASNDLQAAQTSVSALRARLETDEAEHQKLRKENQLLEAENRQRQKEFQMLKAIKDSDENAFAQQLMDLQRKVNETDALVRNKDEEIANVSARGTNFYMNRWEKTQKALQANIAAEREAKMLLTVKLAEVSRIESGKDEEITRLQKEKADMQQVLKLEQAKLLYAVDKENAEMQHAETLKADNKALGVSSQKEKELELELAKLRKYNEDVEASNTKLISDEKHEKEEVQIMQQASRKAIQKVIEERKRMDFAVDQENTELLEVKILQGENRKLKDSLANQTDLEAELKQLNADRAAKDEAIKTLETQNADASEKMKTLMGQMADLKNTNGLLEDQYIRERSKLVNIADHDTTESMALKVVEGENQYLKEQLKGDEAELAKSTKATQAKAADSETLENEGAQMKRELAALRQKEEDLEHKNGELQETIATMAAKSRDDNINRFLHGATSHPRPVQQESSQPDGLEKASFELSKLQAQLRKNTQGQKEKTEAADTVAAAAFMTDD